MTLKNAISQIRETQATKRPSMSGYILKDTTGLSEEDISSGKYRLVFVGKDGERTAFPMNGLYDDSDTTMVINKEFIENMIADNWIIASIDDFESSRIGKGNW